MPIQFSALICTVMVHILYEFYNSTEDNEDIHKRMWNLILLDFCLGPIQACIGKKHPIWVTLGKKQPKVWKKEKHQENAYEMK